MNNDLIAATAERVADGTEASYDNASTIDTARLTAYAASLGGLAGPALRAGRFVTRAMTWYTQQGALTFGQRLYQDKPTLESRAD